MNVQKKKINLAILGCGRVALHYVKFLKKIKNASVNAVCDKRFSKAKLYAKNFKCRYYTNYNLMLKNNKIDLIVILTPSGYHYVHAMKALNYGLNVLLEKPITLKISHAEKLLKIAKKKKLILEVAFQNRYNLAVRHLKKSIDNNKFGKIISTSVVLRWCRFQNYYKDEWHGKWKLDGGVISQQAIHHLDALNWLLGPIESVSAKTSNTLNKLEAEDTIVCNFRLKNGALSTLEATTAARPKDYEASITVVGEKGIAKIGGIALNKIVIWDFINKNKNDKLVFRKYFQNFKNGYGESHFPLIKNILKNINKKKIDYKSTEFAIETTKLINGIYRSDELKKVLLLKNKPKSKRLGV